jgi:hypothetical protein
MSVYYLVMLTCLFAMFTIFYYRKSIRTILESAGAAANAYNDQYDHFGNAEDDDNDDGIAVNHKEH